MESPAAMLEPQWCRWPRGSGLPFFARAKKGNPKKARPGAA